MQTAKPEMMDIELVDIDSLMLDPHNARIGNVESIMDSLKRLGQHRPLVCRRENRQIIVGNHTWKAAKNLGWDKITVAWVDDDEQTAIIRGLADNATGDKATWEESVLADLFIRTMGEEIPGFTQEEIDKILAENAPPSDEKKDEPIYKLVPKIGEEYDYVLIVATNATDCAWLETVFNIPPHKSYKNGNIGRTHVIDVEEFKEIMDLEV